MLIKDFKCPFCGFDLGGYDIPVMSTSDIITETAVCPECGKEIPIPKPATGQGITLGDFVLENKIGSGGMGEVWLATQISLGRKAAVKILSPNLAQNPDYVARFIQEAKLSANLSHPNIVMTFSAGDEKGLKYMAAEFIEGEDLEQKIDRDGTIPEKEALGIARCVASALDYAWNKSRILHRDIKPANIMIDKSGGVKLMDMGISKSLDADSSMTMTGMMVGTPHYMSIEQAMGKKDLDFRSDEYSLGATLYHMVAGEVPFEAATTMAVLMRHVNDPLPSPKDKNPALSDQCVALIEIMMAKAPENRHKSWKDLIADIDLVLTGKYPGSAPRPQPSATMVGKAIEIHQEKGTAIDVGRTGDTVPPSRQGKGLLLWASAIALVIALTLLFCFKDRLGIGGKGKVAAPPPVQTTHGTVVNTNKTEDSLYLVVDISGDPDAKSCNMTYLAVAPSDLTTNQKYKTTNIVMRKIPAGTFMMGETGNQHNVTLTKDYYIGVFEVTQEQWEKIMKPTPSAFKDVEKDVPKCISWDDCQTLMKELNGKFKTLVFRLPTESEWEYACRGGNTSKGFEYSGSNNPDEVAWFECKTHPVGQKKANELGIYDMSGNVWEWCSDWRGEYPKEPEKDPQGAKTGLERVNRGGGWNSGGADCRSAARRSLISSYGHSDVGFRLALSEPRKDIPTVASVPSTTPTVDDATAETMIKAAIEELKKNNPAQKEWKVEYKKSETGWELRLNNNSDLSDISLLKGLPLSLLTLDSTKVSDINVLKGMPLQCLHFVDTKVSDINALKGMQLKDLVFWNAPISDITPLKDMPLISLGLSGTKVTDLSPLKGMPLEHLALSGLNITDISPLKDMPLEDLGLADTKVPDISALKNIRLKNLSLHRCPNITDISVLKGMPLEFLDLNGCDKLSNLSPLIDCKSLKKLSIPGTCKNIEFLRALPNLEILDTKFTGWSKKTAAEFWKDYDAAKEKSTAVATWTSILANANTAYDGKKWQEASDLYQKAVDEMIKDTTTDSDILTKQLAAAQKNLGECRSQIEKPEAAPETNTEIKYTRTEILELFKNINPKWKETFLDADSAYRGKKSKSALISYRKLSQTIINDTTTNQDIAAKALALVEDRIRELENLQP